MRHCCSADGRGVAWRRQAEWVRRNVTGGCVHASSSGTAGHASHLPALHSGMALEARAPVVQEGDSSSCSGGRRGGGNGGESDACVSGRDVLTAVARWLSAAVFQVGLLPSASCAVLVAVLVATLVAVIVAVLVATFGCVCVCCAACSRLTISTSRLGTPGSACVWAGTWRQKA